MPDREHATPATPLETYMSSDEPFDVMNLAGRYPSYLNQLSRLAQKPDDSMDALIVPTARPVENIETAASLAKATGTRLITLCSHEVTSAQMADKLDDLSVPEWWAVDVPPGYKLPFVNLKSATEIPDQTKRTPSSNLSDKRNAGVAIAKALGWNRIMFNDDDITFNPALLSTISLMLPGHNVAGLRFKINTTGGASLDKAVVNHAEDFVVRFHSSGYVTGWRVEAGHISGNSIAVDPQTSGIFFPPEIYDEDLFAFYDMYVERSAALVNKPYFQAQYDPFADPDRARTEEFGEILTDGLYEPMRKGFAADFTDLRYWDTVVAERRWWTEYILKGVDAPQNPRYFSSITKLPERSAEEKTRVANSLLASLAVNATITGEMCVNYYRLWRADQAHWQKRLASLPSANSMREVLGYMGLSSYATNGLDV